MVFLWSKETLRCIPKISHQRGNGLGRLTAKVTATTHTHDILRFFRLEFGVNIHSDCDEKTLLWAAAWALSSLTTLLTPGVRTLREGPQLRVSHPKFPLQVSWGTFYNNHLTFSPEKCDLCCDHLGSNSASACSVMSRSPVTADRGLPFPWLTALPLTPSSGGSVGNQILWLCSFVWVYYNNSKQPRFHFPRRKRGHWGGPATLCPPLGEEFSDTEKLDKKENGDTIIYQRLNLLCS